MKSGFIVLYFSRSLELSLLLVSCISSSGSILDGSPSDNLLSLLSMLSLNKDSLLPVTFKVLSNVVTLKNLMLVSLGRARIIRTR